MVETRCPLAVAAVNCNDNRAGNDNGRLVCESQRVGKNRWEGSFEQSCRDIYMDADGTLTALHLKVTPISGCDGFEPARAGR